ncbi:MAG: flavodoxin family protein [Deltaproteobacteria bacterium]|nr:MAG: flavodoxin family protein [Deltaproteobacteria bacterium]
MVVLGLYGSPRKGGNTDQLLDRALEGSKAHGAIIKKIYARRVKVAGCLECGGCNLTGICVQKDEMVNIYPLFDQAQAIIMSAPVFFYSPPAQIKAIIDRAQAHWAKRRLTKTKEQLRTYDSGMGYLIATGATKGKRLFDCTKLVAKYFFDALDMDYGGEVLVRGLEKKSDIFKVPSAMEAAYQMGTCAARAQRAEFFLF